MIRRGYYLFPPGSRKIFTTPWFHLRSPELLETRSKGTAKLIPLSLLNTPTSTERQRLANQVDETRVGLQTSEIMHGHQHSNLGFAQVEQEFTWIQNYFNAPCDRSSSLFTRSLCALAAPFHRSVSLSNSVLE